MAELIPQSRLNAVINEQAARSFYEDGARRWRMPHQGRRVAPNGLDTDSMHFRGIRAAFEATHTLPFDYDAEGKQLPLDPTSIKEHYNLGLTAIQAAGMLELDDRFVGAYQGWADLVVRDQARLLQNAQKADHTQPLAP